MPFLGALATRAFRAAIMRYASFTDNFNRSTSGSLGTSSSGGIWTALSGVWSANGTKATTATSASSYPIASIETTSSNVTLQATSPDNGAGVAFWITDASSWWAVLKQRNDSSYYVSCNCTQAPTYSCNCTQAPTYTCNCSTCGGGQTCGQCSGLSCEEVFCSPTCCTTVYWTCNCTTAPTYSCGCSTCGGGQTCSTCGGGQTCDSCLVTDNNYWLRIFRSVSGTVTQMAQRQVSTNSNPGSMRVITSGSGITARAFSTTSFTSQLSTDLTYTASGDTPARVGIILGPSANGQGTSLDDFSSTV